MNSSECFFWVCQFWLTFYGLSIDCALTCTYSLYVYRKKTLSPVPVPVVSQAKVSYLVRHFFKVLQDVSEHILQCTSDLIVQLRFHTSWVLPQPAASGHRVHINQMIHHLSGDWLHPLMDILDAVPLIKDDRCISPEVCHKLSSEMPYILSEHICIVIHIELIPSTETTRFDDLVIDVILLLWPRCTHPTCADTHTHTLTWSGPPLS